MMELKCDFSKVKIGDTIFSARNGKVKVLAVDGDGFGADFWYNFNGFPLDSHTPFPMAYWSEPEIIIPEPPKRMVKREIAVWLLIGDDECIIATCNPDYAAAWKRNGLRVEEFTEEIEVKE